MGALEKMRSDLAPFFQYATQNNPSLCIDTWEDDSRTCTRRAYVHCVSCNTYRFPLEQLITEALYGEDTYFCKPCYHNLKEVQAKYQTNESEFIKLYASFLFYTEVGSKIDISAASKPRG